MLRRTPLTKIEPALVCERAAAAAAESGADHTTVLLDVPRSGAFFVHDDAGIASPPERTAGSCPGHCAMVRPVADGGMVAVSFSWSRPERRRDVAAFLCRNTRTAPATEARGASAAVAYVSVSSAPAGTSAAAATTATSPTMVTPQLGTHAWLKSEGTAKSAVPVPHAGASRQLHDPPGLGSAQTWRETPCPISTEGWTRRVQLVREGGGEQRPDREGVAPRRREHAPEVHLREGRGVSD